MTSCAAPILCDIPHNGKIVKALAQPTKQSFLYVLNRETGEPIWPIRGKDGDPGRRAGRMVFADPALPHQAAGLRPPGRHQGRPDRLHAGAAARRRWRSPAITSWARSIPRRSWRKKDGPFGVINLPGYIGGINWPGGSLRSGNPHRLYLFPDQSARPSAASIPNPGSQAAAQFDYVHANPAAGSTRACAPGDLTVDGLPLIKPPYGRITATDLDKRHPELAGRPWRDAGLHPQPSGAEGPENSAHRHDRQDRAADHQVAGDLRRSR